MRLIARKYSSYTLQFSPNTSAIIMCYHRTSIKKWQASMCRALHFSSTTPCIASHQTLSPCARVWLRETTPHHTHTHKCSPAWYWHTTLCIIMLRPCKVLQFLVPAHTYINPPVCTFDIQIWAGWHHQVITNNLHVHVDIAYTVYCSDYWASCH